MRSATLLTDPEIKAAIKVIKDNPLATGVREIRDNTPRGLVLRITLKGNALWSFSFRLNGKASRFGLGVYPQIKLKDEVGR